MKRLATKGALASRKNGLDPDDLPTLDGPRTASLWLDRVGRAVATGTDRRFYRRKEAQGVVGGGVRSDTERGSGE